MATEPQNQDCGPYRLEEFVGSGGIADVWRGIHDSEGIEAAIKIVNPSDDSGDSQLYSNFRQELQTVARLMHPNIVHIYDYGEVSDQRAVEAELPERAPYIAMEYGDMGTLRECGVHNWTHLKGVLLHILEALSYAHARDVIHRDLKPENVLLFSQGDGTIRFKLTDFGLVHAMSPEVTSETQDVFALTGGTPHYMPPEQFLGRWREFGPPTDLYALGCMAYEIVSGKPPFEAESIFEIADKHRREAFPELEPRFEVPDEFESWVRALVAKMPGDRFQLAADAKWHLMKMQAPRESSDICMERLLGGVPAELGTETADEEDFLTTGGHLEKPTVPVKTVILDDMADDTESVRPAGNEKAFETPPVPEQWRRPVQKNESIQVKGAGLQLFALREPPFVGRQMERNRIWRSLREVECQREPRGIVLSGERGVGKSHLTRWICRRAHETGAARVLFVPFGAAKDSKTGFSYMLEVFFRTSGLDREETYERIRRKIEPIYPSSANSDYLEYESKALTEIVHPTLKKSVEQKPDFNFFSLSEKHTTITRFLQHVSRNRPVILWMDNIHRGKEALDYVTYLLESKDAEDLSALFVLTTEDRDVEIAGHVRRTLETLRDKEVFSEKRLSPLKESRHSELLDQLLRLSGGVKDRLLKQLDGRPLFTIQLLEDWIERQILEFNDNDLLELRQAVSVPDDINELWLNRINRLLELFPSHDRGDQRKALEVAAALGLRIDRTEWHSVCSKLGIQIHKNLVDELVESGFVTRHQIGWRFKHDLLREGLERAAKANGRWNEFNCVAAFVLGEMYERPTVDIIERRTDHFIEGNDYIKALEPLHTAIERAQYSGDYDKAQRLIDKRKRITEKLDDDNRIRTAKNQNSILQAGLCRSRGDSGKAKQIIQELIGNLPDEGTIERGRILSLRAVMFCDNGEPNRSIELFREANDIFEKHDDRRMLAKSLMGLSWAYRRLGELQLAREGYRKTARLFDEIGERSMVANVKRQISRTWRAEGNLGEATDAAQKAIEIAEGSANRRMEALCWNNIGEDARQRQKWDLAIDAYDKARRLWELSGDRDVVIAELNGFLSRVGEGHLDTERRTLEDFERRLRDSGYHFLLPVSYLVRAYGAIERRDFEHWTTIIVEAKKLIDEMGSPDSEIAWMAERNASALSKATKPKLARRAARLAAEQWTRLGQRQEADRLRDEYELAESDSESG